MPCLQLRDRALRVDLAAPRARERTHEQTPQGSHQRADRQREDQDPTEVLIHSLFIVWLVHLHKLKYI